MSPKLDPQTALKVMRAKNLEPLEEYPGAMKPWKCKCLDCGNVIQPRYAHIQQGRKGCTYCGIKKNAERVRVSETKPSLSVTHPDLAKQAVNWNPDKITSGSHKILSWKCELGHQWNAQVKSRALSGNNCPICSGHVVLAGFNDLKTANPILANEAFGWDPRTVTPFSGKKVFWKCSSGHITEVRIASRSGGIGCPVCSGHKVLQGFNDLITSHPELLSEIDGWDPTLITKGHDKKLPWICKFGHKWEANVYTRTGKDKVGCPVCSGIKVLTGFNDLKTRFPEIASQALGWDPSIISAGNNNKFLWKCAKGHEWKMGVDQRTLRGFGCLVCSNRQVLVGYNDLATTHPELARQAIGWDPTSITGGSEKKLLWQCNLGHQWKATVESRTRLGRGCPYCAGKQVLTGFNDLQTRFPKIAKEADGWDPSKVNSGAHRKLTWKCSLGHSYSADVGVRTGGSKSACPICAGKQVLAGFNDLKSKYPEIAEQAYGWDPEKIASGSSKKLVWKCSENHIWKTIVSHRTGNHKSGCPTCSKYGFDPNKDGYLYFVSHQDWEMFQIGITNIPDDRLKDHKKLGWEVLELRGPMDGHLIQQWETAILRMLKKKGADLSNEKIAGKFDGYSEAWTKATFPVDSIKELMRLTDEYEENLGKIGPKKESSSGQVEVIPYSE